MDVAWMWTLGQTRRKSERTFHNVITWTNLPVENESALRLENDTIQLELTPYQIMTLRVKPQ